MFIWNGRCQNGNLGEDIAPPINDRLTVIKYRSG
jgi:hypothetical protein